MQNAPADQHPPAGPLIEAEALYRQLVSEDPRNAGAWHSLGSVLVRLGRTEEAVIPLRQAVNLAPDRPDFQHYLALVLEMAGRVDEAVDLHRNVLAMAHANAVRFNMTGNARLALSQMHYHLAFALEMAGKLDESENHYRQAIFLNPENFAARVNFPVLLQKKDRSQEAWREFFAAMTLNDPPRHALSDRRWDGSNPTGKRILVSTDGQFGDSMLLARFVPLLRQRGAYVILQCQPALLALLAPLADEAIAVGSPQPEFDFYAPLAGLPLDLGFAQPPDPSGCPYLAPPADRTAPWTDRVPQDGILNIGLVWAGSETDRSRFRSHSIQVFASLAEVKPARFFSLQKGQASSEQPPRGLELIDFTNELRDFADTASLIERLDLVIGVDTAVLHCAAALNKPAWVLIPWRANFFWSTQRTDSPWYPSARLFRQTRSNDWQTPVAQMAQSLRSMIFEAK